MFPPLEVSHPLSMPVSHDICIYPEIKAQDLAVLTAWLVSTHAVDNKFFVSDLEVSCLLLASMKLWQDN